MMVDKNRPPQGGDDVAKLIRLAGRRPEVPADRAARVKAAARESWKDAIRRRRRTRYTWTAAIAAAAMIVIAVALNLFTDGAGTGPSSDMSIIVESLAGSTWTKDVGIEPLRTRELVVGAEISPGADIATGADGRLAIRFDSGHSVRLDSGSLLRVVDSTTVALDRGAVYVDSGSGGKGDKALSVETPMGVIREIGTQFEVRLREEALRIRVREGSVVLKHDGNEQRIPPSTELLLHQDGSSTTRKIGTHGSDWEWLSGIVPMIDLEGLHAKTFLEWAAREGGWDLIFTDELLERQAEQTELGGSLDGMSLYQALDAVLPTCRLSYRIENGTLLIEPAGKRWGQSLNSE